MPRLTGIGLHIFYKLEWADHSWGSNIDVEVFDENDLATGETFDKLPKNDWEYEELTAIIRNGIPPIL